ncbi:hypothetical protein ACFL6Y_05295 [Elusimicrobiota bacterium]
MRTLSTILVLAMAICGFGKSDLQAAAQEPVTSNMNTQENDAAMPMRQEPLEDGIAYHGDPIGTQVAFGVRG